jgi:predicted  nucleic acid-binding Zn-ribbon protein
MKESDELEKQIKKAAEALKKAKKENATLRDEVDSLWAMMDEITKSDIENFSHLVSDLKSDVITKSLMVTKKKADC